MFKLLYRIGKTEEKFSKLEWIDKPRKENDEISPFFRDSLTNIFPELKLFIFKKNGEKTTRYWLKEAKKELDAICGYPKGQFFVILEYKNKKPRKIIEQVRGYLEIFSESGKDCSKLVDDLNDFFTSETSGTGKNKDIKWEETRLIGISSELPSEKGYYNFTDIIWVKSEGYKNNGETVVSLESEDKENLLELFSGKGTRTEKPKIENLPQFLSEIKISKKDLGKGVEGVHKIITKNSLLSVAYYPYGVIKYKENRTRLLWIWISKNSLVIYFDPRTEETLLPLTKKYKSSFQFKGYRNIKVKDENDFQKALVILKEFLTKTKDKNE